MIRIECTGADSLPLDAIEEFQGNLKKRSKKDIELIITSIEKYGFSFPFFIWNGTGHNYCLDGHGRIQALSEMRRKGEDLPMFPVVYVEAKDEAEAKNKLLRLNSQYGEMTIESVMEFTDGIDIQFEELCLGLDEKKDINDKKGKKETLEPYTKIHILLSFEPNTFIELSEYLEKIKEIQGVEYEQSAN
jgi:hypothetical protein